MSRTKKRLIAIAISGALLAGLHALLSHELALRDPVAAVLMGRIGTVGPLVGGVLLVRVVLLFVVPAYAAYAGTAAVLEELASRRLRDRARASSDV